jgi:hypothetical protein
MGRSAQNMLILLVLTAAAIAFSGCPVMGETRGSWVSGKIYVPDAIITGSYSVVGVNVYTPEGTFINRSPISGSESPLSWNMEISVAEGTPVTFWVELSNEYDSGFYFAPGQQDVIVSGTVYDWTINSVKIPIFTEADLKKIGTIYLGGQDFVLVSDIQLKESWEPLCHPGDSTAPFSGSFDGNGRTISGLRFEDGTDDYIGLFAQVAGSSVSKHAVIKNLKLVLAMHELELHGGTEQKVGFAVAQAKNTDLDRVSVTGTGTGMSIKKNDGSALYAGGIAGLLAGNSSVSLCSSTIPLTITSPSVPTVAAGGLVGKLEAISMATGVTTGNIYRSYSSSAVSVTLQAAGGIVYAGGIAGGATLDSSLWIEECYTSGNISVYTQDKFAVGGMIGGANGSRSSSDPPLFFSRSVVMAEAIRVESTSAGIAGKNVGMISGNSETYDPGPPHSAPLPIPTAAYQDPLPMRYFALDILYGSYQPVRPPGADTFRSSLTNELFFEPILSDGMNWDSNQTWKWDAAKRRPVFQWE